MSSKTDDTEVLVVGGGVMGAATAWHLARRGHEVVLLERFDAGHTMGASHGATRNFNTAYAEPYFLDLVLESRGYWTELGDEAGQSVLDEVGLINHGGGRDRWEPVRQALTARGETAEWIDRDEAARRWPALRFRDHALWVPGGARIWSAAALAAFHDQAVRAGAQLRFGTKVLALRRSAHGVTAETADGEVTAKTVVVTAGAWTSPIVGELLPLPEMVVAQVQPAHFAPLDPGLATLPGFNHAPDPGRPEDSYFHTEIYGLLTPGEGIKAGWHGAGSPIDPDARTFEPDPEEMADLQRYVREWLPGADPEQCVPISCTYTNTRGGVFVLDAKDGVVVGAGFSGHGFKFAPAIGRVLADLATGRDARLAREFRAA